MKAVLMTAPGPVEVLSYEEIPEPAIQRPTQIKVRLHAAGVNPIDTKIRSRGLFYGAEPPAILGCDGAGEVVSLAGRRGGARWRGLPAWAGIAAALVLAVALTLQFTGAPEDLDADALGAEERFAAEARGDQQRGVGVVRRAVEPLDARRLRDARGRQRVGDNLDHLILAVRRELRRLRVHRQVHRGPGVRVERRARRPRE